MDKLTLAHPSEETLEEYCFDRLSEQTKASVEEHLLVCTQCQNTLEALDEYIALMKAATEEFLISEEVETVHYRGGETTVTV